MAYLSWPVTADVPRQKSVDSSEPNVKRVIKLQEGDSQEVFETKSTTRPSA
jgi:hypothetical protein